MATMKDIAKIANVSTSTVSHVINNSRFVSEEIREKVLQVVKELNYTPSALARSLKVNETKTLGMLVTASDNPFFAEVIRSTERYCYLNNYNLIISYTDGDTQRLQKNIHTLIQKKIDGLILMCSDSHWQLENDLTHQLQLPKVIMDWWPIPLEADKIYENSIMGGYLATKTLLEYGHRHIAIITGNLNKSLAQNRLLGYKNALNEWGVQINSDWIVEAEFSFAGGVTGMQQLLQQKQRPTALFACADTIAIGAYQAAWQAGLHIPEDISIIGYDDINITQYLSPPLTTIHQPKNRLAKLAIQKLLHRIKQPDAPFSDTILTPELCLRSSVIHYTPK